MERCNSNRCGCNRRGMMNSNRSCPGNMMADNNRCDNACGSMCDSRDNNACMRDVDNMCSRSSDMDTRNRRDGNMRSGCRRDNMRSGCRRDNMRNSCGRDKDMDSRCRMDNDMSSRRGNMNDMEGFALAMAYVPWQQWGEIYPLNTGLQRGTIFPELDKPFFKGRCCDL